MFRDDQSPQGGAGTPPSIETYGPTPQLPTIGRVVVNSIVVTTIVMFLVVTGGMWLATGRLGDGAVLATFTTVWGGPGFGVMVAGAIDALRADKAAATTRSGE